MDVFTAIVQRRSIRKYLDKPVEFDKITAVLEAGSFAPSAGNLQDWKFIVVTDKGLISEIAKYAVSQNWITTAPVLIVVCSQPEKQERFYGLKGKRMYAIQDAAVAAENILLAATALDLGSCWVGAFEEDQIKDLLSIPGHVTPTAIITLGYPDETPKEKQNTALESMVYFNRYGMRIEKLHMVLKDYSVEWQQRIEQAKPVVRRGFHKIKESFKKLKEKLKRKPKEDELEEKEKTY